MHRGRRHRRFINTPGEAHELTFSCYRGFRFLESDRTRGWLAEAINAARQRYAFEVYGYVFMPEHAHLIMFPMRADYGMAQIVKAIKEPVGRRAIAHLRRHDPVWLERVTRRRGQRTESLFWQSGGGYDRNVDRFPTLEAMIDYAHENPVRRRLVATAIDWPWSSARWYYLGEPGPIAIDPVR